MRTMNESSESIDLPSNSPVIAMETWASCVICECMDGTHWMADIEGYVKYVTPNYSRYLQ